MRKIVLIALVVVLAGCLSCPGCEKQPNQNPGENEGLPSDNWKEYESLVGIWPRLKEEGIEGIRFCSTISLEYGYELPQDFRDNANAFGFRERAAAVVRWWPTLYKVPEEKLTECIKIIDRAIKKADESYRPVFADRPNRILRRFEFVCLCRQQSD